MGQKITKKELERAELFYKDQRFDDAVEDWKRALKRVRKPQDRFQLCGRICLALCDVGKYREALTFAGQQCEIATAIDDATYKADAFFNIAISNEKSCEFAKAISYCKRTLQMHPDKAVLSGKINLCLANAYAGISEFRKAWTNYVRAMDEAKSTSDRVLELQTSAKMGTLFCRLGDYESCTAYCNNALELLGDLMDDDPDLKYRRQVVVQIAEAFRKQGRLAEAMDSCEDAMKIAMRYSDRPVQARCLYLFADIHRKRSDAERAYPRYESAYSIMSEIGDRVGQMEVLGGMAKTAVLQRDYEKASELNNKALDLSAKVDCKLGMLRCHARQQLLNERQKHLSSSLDANNETYIKKLVQEMELFCGVCGEVIGQNPERLEPLSCGHFVHARCAPHLARSTLGRAGRRRPCPACRSNSSRNPALHLT
ncbi:43 kda receptor-associated protein of the synapse [Plakobranchus ocellatus]|uniref:43 kDa receptor-associated protein of the synapse n=1 Tax=Plakobranchus ocellatus TaxID=259542 RepID=A0AAV4CAX3_9GAST|nr:43 kda receptor-associated protein of the synapse [Plakobranchus ocellatus]